MRRACRPAWPPWGRGAAASVGLSGARVAFMEGCAPRRRRQLLGSEGLCDCSNRFMVVEKRPAIKCAAICSPLTPTLTQEGIATDAGLITYEGNRSFLCELA